MKYNQPFLLLAGLSLMAMSPADPPSKATLAIHDKAITIDTHCDTPMKFTHSAFDIGQKHPANEGRVDIPKMEKGGLDAIFFALFTSQRERTEANYQMAYNLSYQMLDSVNQALALNANRAELALSSDDAYRLSRAGKRAIYLGMENGFPLATDIKRVEEFYNQGVRYITLAHTSNNDICDSSTDKKGPEHNGLSPFGKEVVKEMNRLGMLIDVSHISDQAFYDVLATTSAPVIASHSSVRAVCDHPRNMSDEIIRALAKNGGVIQICILGAYIQPEDTTSIHYIKMQELRRKYNNYNYKDDEERQQAWAEWRQINNNYPAKLPTVADAVDHIDHVVKLVGIDYVGIGSDFDGGGALADCQDVSEFPNITQELINRGYSAEDINKIWGGNFLRVFKQVEAVAGKNKM